MLVVPVVMSRRWRVPALAALRHARGREEAAADVDLLHLQDPLHVVRVLVKLEVGAEAEEGQLLAASTVATNTEKVVPTSKSDGTRSWSRSNNAPPTSRMRLRASNAFLSA